MTLEQLGFTYTGRCACQGRPEKWVHADKMELKVWNTGRWKLIRRGFVVRYGNIRESIPVEVEEYMTNNNL